MTFLELCQRTAAESGTFGGAAQPSAVTSQEGRLLNLVNWVAQAWTDLQTSRKDWLWLEADYSGGTLSGQRNYSASDFGISSRFGTWIYDNDQTRAPVTIYLTSAGKTKEQRLTYVPYRKFRSIFQFGSNDSLQDYPQYFTIAPNKDMLLHPIPDAAYTVTGLYRKSAQVLAANGDTPEIDSQHHMVIVWRALCRHLAIYDEATVQQAAWQSNMRELEFNLLSEQTPKMEFADSWANGSDF